MEGCPPGQPCSNHEGQLAGLRTVARERNPPNSWAQIEQDMRQSVFSGLDLTRDVRISNPAIMEGCPPGQPCSNHEGRFAGLRAVARERSYRAMWYRRGPSLKQSSGVCIYTELLYNKIALFRRQGDRLRHVYYESLCW